MLNPFKLSQSGSKAHLELVEGNGFAVNNASSTHPTYTYRQTNVVWLNSSRIWTGNYLSTARKTVHSEGYMTRFEPASIENRIYSRLSFLYYILAGVF
ncbi:hypothetical protein PV327_001796 [Microctonus hyperodae]|uniref:Uncharacterized protein n=1 Tax=Microctonus hyperodae TaxID=165561 RepID=A0AA39FE82_MICHY|nr:hypothetical protein PV327_001796 [Microctonus hyperodae]